MTSEERRQQTHKLLSAIPYGKMNEWAVIVDGERSDPEVLPVDPELGENGRAKPLC